ncbi:MAG: signal peptidase I [Pirellulaceae bacterium]|nr:signal peptidase I [Pirellulaceae bacterium]
MADAAKPHTDKPQTDKPPNGASVNVPAGEAATASAKKEKRPPNPHAIRETVESVIVAFILAFLFRAFVAEAFVIPTGSMAPTLMGAHKDTVCEHCGALYQSTASPEYDNENRNSFTDVVAVGSTCAACRATNAFDLAGNRNHATFSGDRILVSKFDYLFRDPQRWDVLVFKYPTDARMNYIKRLVGLPGEYLHIEGGDVYVRKAENEPWQLARKPAHKALAMMQVVSDTKHQARDLVASGWPSMWQPLSTTSSTSSSTTNSTSSSDNTAVGSWQVEQTPETWSATLPANSQTQQWLRYYHKYFDKEAWSALTAQSQAKLDIDPYSSTLITDFLAYNTTRFGPRSDVYEDNGSINSTFRIGRRGIKTGTNEDPGKLREGISSDQRPLDVIPAYKITFHGLTGLAQDGMHWVGDLSAEYDAEITGSTGTVSLDVVEFGIHYTCDIDVASGQAKLRATENGQPLNVFANDIQSSLVTPTAATSVRGAGRHRLRLANVDDQIMLWVDGQLIQFDQPTTFDSQKFRAAEARRPYWTPADPLDAAPLAIGAQGAGVKVHRAQVWRDIYYIAVPRGGDYSDYPRFELNNVIASLKDAALKAELVRDRDGALNLVAWIYSHPEMWSDTSLFSKRGALDFRLEEGQFFPMGDNSAASSDARVWYSHPYVERRFLIGKALLVFWPHLWKAPVPHPNIPRMGRIR